MYKRQGNISRERDTAIAWIQEALGDKPPSGPRPDGLSCHFGRAENGAPIMRFFVTKLEKSLTDDESKQNITARLDRLLRRIRRVGTMIEEVLTTGDER